MPRRIFFAKIAQDCYYSFCMLDRASVKHLIVFRNVFKFFNYMYRSKLSELEYVSRLKILEDKVYNKLCILITMSGVLIIV